jgi:hypothetical protein
MNFSYYRSITIDHTKCGNSNSSAFPLLVSLSDSTLSYSAGHVKNNLGYDIYFFADAALTVRLPAEREFYSDSSGIGTYVGWVQVPTVYYNADTIIYMAYGDSSISTDPNADTTYGARKVWDAYYMGVWHLGNGSSLSVVDSTGLNSATNHSAGAVSGKIDGGAALVAANSQYIDAGGSVNVSSPLTVQAWIYPNSVGSLQRVVSNLTGSAYKGYELYYGYTSDSLMQFQIGNNGSLTLRRTTNNIGSGAWFHVAGTLSGSTMLLYVNGVVPAQSSNAVSGIANSNVNLNIGKWPGGNGNYFNGKIDEVRISSIARSADWITTEYNNQYAPGNIGSPNFYTVGSENIPSIRIIVNLDSLIQKTGITHVVSLDGNIAKTKTVAALIDSYLKKAGITDVVSLDSYLQKKNKNKTTVLDSYLQKLGIAKTISIDSLIGAVKTGAISVDAFVAITRHVSLSLDGYIRIGKVTSAEIDALIAVSKTKSANLDAFVQTQKISFADIDALIQKKKISSVCIDSMVQAHKHLTISMDSLIQMAQAGFLDIDALIAARKTGVVSLDAIIHGGGIPTISALLDAFLQKGYSLNTALDALLAFTRSHTVSFDAFLMISKVEAISFDALLAIVLSKSINLDALIVKGFTRNTIIDALIRQIKERSISLDALLLMSALLKSTNLDAMLAKTGRGQALLDALLLMTYRHQTLMDAVLVTAIDLCTTRLDALIISSGYVVPHRQKVTGYQRETRIGAPQRNTKVSAKPKNKTITAN